MSDLAQYAYHIDPEDHSTAAKVLRLVGSGQRVLELGTAVGSMTRVMQQHYGCRVVGVELDPEMAEQARGYCERLVVADLESLDWSATFGAERFDVIVAADVLEHLRDPWACLRSVRDYLKPDGSLVVSVPNIAHIAVLAHLLIGRFPYAEKGLLDRSHLRFFTRTDLEDLLLTTGFLPIAWDRNDVAVTETELGGAWCALPQELREYLVKQPHAQTYQFIAKAVPGNDFAAMTKLRADLNEARAAAQRERAAAEGRVQELSAFRAESLVRQEELLEAFQGAEKAFHEYRDAYQQESARSAVLEQRLAQQAQEIARQADALSVVEAGKARLENQLRHPSGRFAAAVRRELRRWFGRR